MKKDTIIFYQINLKIYEKIKKRNYRNFSKSELIENILLGNVIIINDKTIFSFEADLFKFFITLSDNLNKIYLKKEFENKIYSINDDYYFYLKLHDENNIKVVFNNQEETVFNIKKLSKNIKDIKIKLFNDFKILYPDYMELKEINYLKNKIEQN
jgi:hypothetical protein